MASRITIELTAKQNEDVWSWRAAGAKLPKGFLSSNLLHDGAILDDLEGQPREFAELLMKGGLQAVRTTLQQQADAAKQAGQPPVDTAPLLTAAEDLWPKLKTAEWMDRAEAALEIVDKAS